MTDQEIDDWMAENVMGWKVEGGFYKAGRVVVCGRSNWRPSERIKDAMEAAEALIGFHQGRRPHPWWSLALFAAHETQHGCRIYACGPGHNIFDTSDVIAEVVADTPTRAVCLAILRAKGVEV